ncbi:MAG: hypothetical protein AMXMBFR84_07480 [Candidatus Hydrogenedentota bacterium]
MYTRFHVILGVLAVAWLAEAPFAQDAPTLPVAVTRPVNFMDDIHSLLAERCWSCHGPNKQMAGLRLDSRDAILKGGESGPAVVEGKSAESYLIELVSGQVQDLIMPPKGVPLNAEQIGILRAWIDQGLKWDPSASQPDAWDAPIEPRRPAIPEAVAATLSDNPVDRFLGPYFQEHAMAPGEPVADAVFVRRAYLDTIGLLPTNDELQAFLNDPNPDKRAQLVRTLLANNQGYAEHWMTFWNDCLRNDFTGTGYIDGGRKSITDWLYRALYNNMPYDQFAMQLVNPTPESEGFVKGIIWRGVTAAVQQPPVQAAKSVSQVFLGVNLKCASCHDSFVDNWKLKDAYGMASIFSDDALELVRCDVPQGEIAAPAFLWQELGAIEAERPRAGRMAQLARTLTSEENGRFTRTMVNRLWAQFFGRGLVEPLDVMGNKPFYPDLLDWLATDLVDSGYNLKHTMEIILTSKAYQLPAVPRTGRVEEATDYAFAGPELRRLSAEQFMDAVSRVTGHWQVDPKFTPPGEDPNDPARMVRAWRVPSDPLTRALGRPNREQVTTRREGDATTLQAVELTNGATFATFLTEASMRVMDAGEPPVDDIINRIYLAALQRSPSDTERAAAQALVGAPVTVDGLSDLLWAVSMLPEFQLIH